MEKVDLCTTVPYIKNHKELEEYLPKVIVLENHFATKEGFKEFQEQIFNLVKGCFTICKCREYPVKFKFRRDDKNVYSLQLRHFLINIFLWYPLIELNDDLSFFDSSFIFDCEHDVPHINDFINQKLVEVLRDSNIKSTKINESINEVLHMLNSISVEFSTIMGLSFSIYTFIDLYEKYPEMKEIMNLEFDENMQPYEIEALHKEYQDREIALLKSLPDNPIGKILRSGTGIKHKQLAEFTIAEGLKPTLTGNTIPIPTSTSTLIGGLTKPSALSTEAGGARLSLVQNKKVMGKAGYFGKIVLMLARTLVMSTTVSDCGTQYLVNYAVTSNKVLKKLNGKYYRLNENDSLKLLDAKKDKDLIGKVIQVRSVATCACTGNECCPVCVGATANLNFDIADGIAAFESEEITKVINQNILSTKHLLSTNSELIEFNEAFDKFFTLTRSEIYPNVNDNQKVPNINDYGIYIAPEDISKVEDMDDDSLFNTEIPNGRFYVRNLKDTTEEDIEIKIKGDKEIYIENSFMNMISKSKDGVVRFDSLSDDIKLFEVTIENTQLTKPLYDLMDMLNKERKKDLSYNDDETYKETIDTVSNKFLNLLIEAGIGANIVGSEMIINRLIRSSNNIMERPDFRKTNLTEDDYQIVTVSKALEKNPSPTVGLSFQNIKRQLLSDEFFYDRKETSFLDDFFRKEISTESLKRYAEDTDFDDEY